ncbi:MAG: tetratricopeptide repeat protein [Bacillota bacterium]|nr:tetratricopeptide repeat protein [Bacillota bacterium]
MNYKDNLASLKENIRFLELSEKKTLGKVSLPKGFKIPISRDSIANVGGGSFNFNFFHIVQNMLFCTALCEDLPLNETYRRFLIELFGNTEKSYLEALLDVRLFEDGLLRAGIYMAYAKYAGDAKAYLMSAHECLDLYHTEQDEAYLKLAKKQLLPAFKMERSAYNAYLLSYVYHAEKDYALALDYAETALEMNPSEELREAIEKDKDELDKLVSISTTRSLMEEGDYASALNYLLANEREDSWEQKFMLGEIYLALKRPEKALDYLKVALELNPAEADIYESMGVALYFLGDASNAIKVLEHGLKLSPRHLEILKNLSILYSKTGRSKVGIKLLQKSKVFYPEDTELDVLIQRIEERLEA